MFDVPTHFDLPLLCFILAALGGAFMFVCHLRYQRPPQVISLVHAGVAIIGWFSLSVITAQHPSPPALAALAVLGVAALIGFGLFFGFRRRGLPLPLGLIIAHGLIALIGLTLLIVARHWPTAGPSLALPSEPAKKPPSVAPAIHP